MKRSNLDLLFAYIMEREAGERGKTIFIQFRRILRRRALLLFLALPFECLLILIQIVLWPWQSRKKTVTLTRMAPDLLAKLVSSGLVYAGAPSWIIFAWRQGASYMPVAMPYILVTLALYLPKVARGVLGRCALGWVAWLYRLYKVDTASLVVHSDALPFARTFVLQARDQGMKTICLQHGIFHANSGMKNFDGYLCDFNVVRSREDGDLICSTNQLTELCVEPDFFLTPIENSHSNNLKPVITLVGEGWRTVDEAFSKKYVERLLQLEVGLLSLGFVVLYRPHPSERLFADKLGFQRVDLSDLGTSMIQTDVFLGYSSTLLIEVAAAGRVAAQLSIDGIFNSGMNRAGIVIWQVSVIQDIIQLIDIARTQNYLDVDLVGRKNRAVNRVYQRLESPNFNKLYSGFVVDDLVVKGGGSYQESSPRFAVLLAAYNGMVYIAEQIDSILKQKNVEIQIFISVDQSSDGTEDRLQEWALSELRLTLLPSCGRFGGAGPNFFRLLREVDLSGFDYLSFADQDDIWHPEKLWRAHSLMTAQSAAGYSSNFTAFWPSGEAYVVNKAWPQRNWDFLFESAGPGCTYVLHSSLALPIQQLLRNVGKKVLSVDYHDWLTYAFARSHNFPWVIDSWSSMQYRQHAHNQIGVNAGWRSFWLRVRKILNGYGFEQSLMIADLVLVSDLPVVQRGLRGGRLGYLWLALHATQCRRKRTDQMWFFISCVLLALFKPADRGDV